MLRDISKNNTKTRHLPKQMYKKNPQDILVKQNHQQGCPDKCHLHKYSKHNPKRQIAMARNVYRMKSDEPPKITF